MLLKHRTLNSEIEFVGESATTPMFRYVGDSNVFFSMPAHEARKHWIPAVVLERRKKDRKLVKQPS